MIFYLCPQGGDLAYSLRKLKATCKTNFFSAEVKPKEKKK